MLADATRGLWNLSAAANSSRLFLQSAHGRHIEGHEVFRSEILTRPLQCRRHRHTPHVRRTATNGALSACSEAPTPGLTGQGLALDVAEREVVLCVLRRRDNGVVLQQLRSEPASDAVVLNS